MRKKGTNGREEKRNEETAQPQNIITMILEGSLMIIVQVNVRTSSVVDPENLLLKKGSGAGSGPLRTTHYFGLENIVTLSRQCRRVPSPDNKQQRLPRSCSPVSRRSRL